MGDLTYILQSNRELAEKITAEARNDPKSPYVGKIVGLANGRVVAITDNWKEVARLVQASEADPNNTYCFEPTADYPEVEEIWRMAECRA
jgi:Tfp pilus assembly protein PilP